jgi:hypothetical protein
MTSRFGSKKNNRETRDPRHRPHATQRGMPGEWEVCYGPTILARTFTKVVDASSDGLIRLVAPALALTLGMMAIGLVGGNKPSPWITCGPRSQNGPVHSPQSRTPTDVVLLAPNRTNCGRRVTIGLIGSGRCDPGSSPSSLALLAKK